MKNKSFMWYLFRYKFELMIIFLLTFLIAITCSCRTVKITETVTKIDTLYINPIIDTVKIAKEYLIKKDTLIFDTIKIENKFSKVKVYVLADRLSKKKIEVELISKPFETKLQAAKTEKQKIKQSNVKSVRIWFGGFFIGSGLASILLLIFMYKKIK